MGKQHSEETLQKYILGKDMYLTGEYSLTAISKELKMSRKWFVEWLRKQDGIVIVNRQNETTTRTDAFKVIDTEEKAYWLGFLYADGYVSASHNTIELMLTAGDRAHVQKFKDFMNCSNIIQEKTMRVEGKDYQAVRLSFKSSETREQLISLGCTPRKTFTIKFPTSEQVPDHLLRHFLRGYIDADGWLKAYMKPVCLRFSVYGTRHFLSNMMDKMGWNVCPIRVHNKSHSIEYGGSLNVLDKLSPLYENSNIYLDRKFKIFQEMKIAVYGENSI